MQSDYVVLRSQGGRARPAGPPPFPGFRPAEVPGSRAPEPLEMSLEVESLNPDEAEDLAREPGTEAIARAMPLKLVEPLATVSNASFSTEAGWGITAVGATDSALDGSGITVAVLDTGIHAEHLAFAGAEVIEEDFTGEGNGDHDGHGTHCAGTIAGRDVNGTRIGVAPGVNRILAGKVLGEDGGSTAGIARAIQWALDNRAHVISMSLGIDFPGFVDQQVRFGLRADIATSLALEEYRNHILFFGKLSALVATNTRPDGAGALLVAAAGNESEHPNVEIATAPPAASEGITAVGAVGLDTAAGKLRIAPFSNVKPNVVGPGVNIHSARSGTHDGLSSLSGTSMATPHVAGVAALIAEDMLRTGMGFNVDVLSARLIGTASRTALATLAPRMIGAGLVRAPRGNP